MLLRKNAITKLASVNLPLNSVAEVSLYTESKGLRFVVTHVVLIAGADMGTSVVTLGQDGALTDFLPAQTLSNIDAQHDAAILQPVPSATPLLQKSYAAGTEFKANVTTANGGATNIADIFGYQY